MTAKKPDDSKSDDSKVESKVGPKPDDSKAAVDACDAMRKELASFQDILGEFKGQLDKLEHRFGRLEISAPADLRAMDVDSVASVLSSDPYAEFEVLVAWSRGTSRMPAGRKLRADHYPRLLDYVRAGLRLGRPDDQSDVIAKYKEEATTKMALAKKEVLDRARTEAEAARIKLDGLTE